jgi:predicted nucleic acid-binding protein
VRFWDTSALVSLVLREAGTSSVRPLYEADQEMALWWGTRTECVSAIVRAIREGRLDASLETRARASLRELIERGDEVAPTEIVRGRAERVLATHPLRAADALQLAAGLTWARERPQGQAFVCLDGRLRDAARREGFTILPAR